LYAFLLDYALYGELISIPEALGVLVILIVTVGVSVYKMLQENKKL
jgi:drug/metabolite transporter (DMT)-like permease